MDRHYVSVLLLCTDHYSPWILCNGYWYAAVTATRHILLTIIWYTILPLLLSHHDAWLIYSGPYPGAVYSRWCLQPSSAGSVWLCICWEPHLQAARTREVLWEAARPHCTKWYSGHHFSIHLARGVHSQGASSTVCTVWVHCVPLMTSLVPSS